MTYERMKDKVRYVVKMEYRNKKNEVKFGEDSLKEEIFHKTIT